MSNGLELGRAWAVAETSEVVDTGDDEVVRSRNSACCAPHLDHQSSARLTWGADD